MYHMDYYNIGAQYSNKLDRSPSPDDWYQWNQGSNGMRMSPVVDNSRENSEISLCGNQVFGDWPEYQYDGQSERDWENDVFMNSLLKDDQPDMKIQYQPSGMYSENECSTKPFDNFLTDTAPVRKILIPDEVNTYPKEDEHVDEETSYRATALQDLEVLMTQLTPKTRIFFRDSLYRLASNSRQHLPSQTPSGQVTLNEPTLSTDHQETSTSGKRKLMELETNIIDRTVANLMFNDLNYNGPDFYSVGSVELSDESVIATSSSFNSNFNQSDLLPSHYSE